ncbi:hypothetical protein [Lysobacter gummosus]|uniref:hypothetical protein n=1 Tax=Lysobacter gummosus TaxID=262324 RepID=UPI00364448A5
MLTAATAQAEPLTPLQAGTLPSLQNASPLIGLATVDGRTLAIGRDRAWRLDNDRHAWLPLQWSAAPWAGAVVGDGTRAYLLPSDADASVAIARIDADDSGARLRPCRRCPRRCRNCARACPTTRSTSPASAPMAKRMCSSVPAPTPVSPGLRSPPGPAAPRRVR